MQFPHILDSEIRRVAKEEGKTMEDLVAELAELTSKKRRQIYNFRSGKHSPPVNLIPVLCKRFGSRALLDALGDDCDVAIEVPEDYELTRLVSQTVRDDLKHYEGFLAAFESSGIDANELRTLNESGARVIQNVRHFEAIAVADYERRQATQSRR